MKYIKATISMKPKFITFEGCDGSGKSTQAAMLQAKLQEKNIPSILTREPGGTKLAESLRNIVLADGVPDPLTELLILTAARRDHVKNVIEPAIKNGLWVICDRFIDSTIVYQGYLKGLDLEVINRVTDIAIGSFRPDVTYIMDIDPKEAMLRRSKQSENHYDQQDEASYNIIRNAFLEIASHGKHYVILDASVPANDVTFID